ncbi:hypothetical protein BDP27DRAFT_1419509 [Rhodocollybia butyracea]|uniref:Uncharacterized protein n=1 Tax=Rhodocollybia butyracea TaxID=206335 RepID=A0A9P5U9G1_9AGAR|nr:hypothetical protein BDP27DRAFT_1419509 [Rhodocollybia butyracea]
MVSSSSSKGGSVSSSSDKIYRSFFVDDEASESDSSEQSDTEDIVLQRLRQKKESVPLRTRGQRSEYETVVDRLEVEAQEALAQREQRAVSAHHLPRRNGLHGPPIPSSPSPIGLPPSSINAPTSSVDSTPPVYEELTVVTCTGPATIRLPLVPGEDELSRETRIFDLENEIQRVREREEIARMAVSIRAAHAIVHPVPASTFPSSPSLVPPVPDSIAPSQALVPAPGSAPSLDISASSATPFQASSGLLPPLPSSPAEASPNINSEAEEDYSFLIDPFGLSSVRKTREPLLFPPLAASKLETLSLFSNIQRSTALDDLAGYEDDDTEGSLQEEGATSTVVHLLPISQNTPATDVMSDIEMASPKADVSMSSSQSVTEGWKLVKQFLNNEISFIRAEEEFNRLFGSDFTNVIWQKIKHINDLDPDELRSRQPALVLELDTQIQMSIDAQQATRPLATTSTTNDDPAHSDSDDNGVDDMDFDDNEPIRYLLFRVRCFRSFENDAFTKIQDDIAASRVNTLVLRAVYKALQPGYIYIEAQSMLSRNIPLSAYLRTVPGLVYLTSPKISFANEKAWSYKHERVKKVPPPIWSAPDSTMPIYQTITEVGFNPQSQIETVLPAGTWVVPSSGRYKGDVGVVVEDEYDTVDNSVSALVMFIPRIKFPNSSSSKRPVKGMLSVDFRKPPRQWQDFEFHSQLKAWCVEDDCIDALECQHQPYLQKRYEIFRQVIRGGFALLIFNISELRLITRMPAGVHATFTELPMLDNLWSDLHLRVPPPESWSFLEGDQVSVTNRFGKTGSLLAKCDLTNLSPGVVGTVLKVHQYVCDVDLHALGHHCIPFYNLVKIIDVGRSVKISDTAGNLQEVKRVELGESTLASVSASRVVLAGRESLVARRYQVPPYGESLDIWIQDLELVITLDPNSVVDNTDDQVYSRHFPPSVPRRVFDEFSVVEKQEIYQRPSLPYHKWNSVAHYDLRNGTSVRESAWLLQNNRRPMHIHPSQYFNSGRFRPPGRLPWFGVRVNVDLGDRIASGEVRDVVPNVDNTGFQVLVAAYDADGTLQSDWFDYLSVRRQDNHGHLHEFSTYTGRVPWQGVQVQVTHGPLKDFGIGIVKDVSVDSNPKSISGLLLDIQFESAYVYGERRGGRVDYDAVRKLDHKFIHDGWSSNMPKNSYFQFKMGYVPTYSEQAQKSLSQRALVSSQNIVSRPSQSPASLYLRFADLRLKDAFPKDFWLLDRRISQILGSREIYVLVPAEGKDVRVSFHHTSTGLELQGGSDHKGGRKSANIIDPRSLSNTPMSLKLKGSSTANGLYLICEGEHSGKLTRRVNYMLAHPPNPENDTWVLQVVRCVWIQAKALDHKESIVPQEPLLRLRKQALTLVHETDRERAQANTIMATLRLQQGGAAAGFTLVNGQAEKARH